MDVDVDIGHRDTVWIKKSLKQQVILQRIKVSNIERKRNDRTCRRPASWPKDNAATLSPVDKVLDDQKIAVVSHIVEHAQLHIEAL